MRLIFFAVGALALAISPVGSAFGKACTDAVIEEQELQIEKFVEDHPDRLQGVVATIAEVESEYGGEPPREKMCEALDKVLKVLLGRPRN